MQCHNPFGFRPGPVTFWTIVVYFAVLFPLLYVHESVPPAPNSPTPTTGINLTDAWHDLTTITKHYHPYNSRDNERVGNYILKRIEEILDNNGVEWTKEESGGVVWSKSSGWTAQPDVESSNSHEVPTRRSVGPAVTVFNDMISNVTWATGVGMLGQHVAGAGTYFEGTNKLVYIRGTDDEDGEWWKSRRTDMRVIGRGGVLVNAHYDSVASGYGATDDGLGCVSVLQMLNYFTTPGRQPKRGIVLLLNNGEEDGLFGARAFAYSPLFSFPTTFVNLEGAGAGGRAILFRASDLEVSRAYQKAPHPFGLVFAEDGFSLGLVKSQTDYVIWQGIYGERGLDIAFYRPRPRYHTNQDDARHASAASLWHMLSNSLAAVETLSSDISGTFSGSRPDGDRRKVPSGSPSQGVWFDMFGKGFAVFGLRGLFAWALTLLIVCPLVLIVVSFILARQDKYYFLAGKINVHDQGSDDPVSLGGFRGLLRFPFAFIVASALTLASAFLVNKINPMIVYSSEYAVWGMMMSLFYVVFWTIMKGASVVRPSALQRGFAHIWLFVFSWAILVVVAVFADRFRIASGYPFVFLNSALFLSTLITLLDLLSLQPKHDFAQRAHDEHQARDQINEVPHDEALIAPTRGEMENTCTSHDGSDDEDEEATETTPLRASETRAGQNPRMTFGATYRRSISAITGSANKGEKRHEPFEGEQTWSGRLASWTWLLQFLILTPINVILFGQLGLVATSATQHTGADGGNTLTVYLATALLSIVLLLPLAPFLHRVIFQVPTILCAVLVGTLIYNLVAFPFSANNRYKVYFQQDVDLDEGTTTVRVTGIEEYVRMIIDELPSAGGQRVTCTPSSGRQGLSTCSYDGSAVFPNLTERLRSDPILSPSGYERLVSLNISRPDGGANKATFFIDADETKACRLSFDRPVTDFSVRGGAGQDARFGRYPDEDVSSIQLFRRSWSQPWTLDVEWDGRRSKSASTDDMEIELEQQSTLEGKLECQWSDANLPGTIPAYDECLQYSPDWVAFSKYGVGLVQVVKKFAA